MSGPTSIRPMAPDVDPPERRVGRSVVVRITLREAKAEPVIPKILDGKDAPREPELAAGLATVETKDGKVSFRIPASKPLLARFQTGETYAYFTAEIFEKEDVVEVGERVEESAWSR